MKACRWRWFRPRLCSPMASASSAPEFAGSEHSHHPSHRQGSKQPLHTTTTSNSLYLLWRFRNCGVLSEIQRRGPQGSFEHSVVDRQLSVISRHPEWKCTYSNHSQIHSASSKLPAAHGRFVMAFVKLACTTPRLPEAELIEATLNSG
jgi:hypothetical protein